MDQLQSILINPCIQQYNEPDESEKTLSLLITYIQKLIKKTQNEWIKYQSTATLFKMPKITERERERGMNLSVMCSPNNDEMHNIQSERIVFSDT